MTEPSRSSSFEGLRRQAKRWLRALRSGDDAALRRLEQALPTHSEPPVLREVQQALARELGFSSWADLKEVHALEAASASDRTALVDVFLEHACIFTRPQDLPVKWRRAERILVRNPDIATSSIHTAVLCGEVEHVRELLAAVPESITSKGGPQQWEPLLFACYGRLARARERGLEMAELLLDAGADPNTYFVSSDEWRLRFNALTGAMGQGEMGQPEHPHARALARMLLERGADPNDSQGLYNTHLIGDETGWLELLFRYGLGPDDPINWHADPVDARRSGADRCPAILDYLASGAAGNGHSKRLALLLERGANPDAESIYDGKSCYQRALLAGASDCGELLLRHGATPKALEGCDAFVAAARSGDRSLAERLVAEHPEYTQIGDPLTEAAQRGEVALVRLLLELGVDPNAESRHGHRALHNACEHVEVARLLLEHGADPRARAFGGSACGWARHAGNLEMARFQAEQSRSLLDAAMSGHIVLARELLAADPTCIGERSPAGDGPLHELCLDVDLAEPLIYELLGHAADPELRNDAGQTPVERLEAMGADDVADLLDAMRG
jgi:ankyrin repeat protein